MSWVYKELIEMNLGGKFYFSLFKFSRNDRVELVIFSYLLCLWLFFICFYFSIFFFVCLIFFHFFLFFLLNFKQASEPNFSDFPNSINPFQKLNSIFFNLRIHCLIYSMCLESLGIRINFTGNLINQHFDFE